MRFEIGENELRILLEKQLYSEKIIFKCFYWYGKNYLVSISTHSHSEYSVKLKPRINNFSSEEWQPVIEKVSRDLIDFKLRDIVTQETKNIRELITAKAFAYYEN